MFEEQTQKLYEGFTDRLNNLFSKKPFLATLIISVVVSVIVFVISSDYKRGEAKIVTGNDVVEGTNLSDGFSVVEKTPKELKVDLAGAVNKPGVYVLPVGSRLQDILALGGGLVSEVSSLWVSKNLNLSQIISDGEKIYIPFEWDLVGLAGEGDVKALNIGVISGSKQSNAVASVIKDITGSTTGADGTGSSQSSSSAGPGNGSESGSSPSGSSTNNLVNVNTATSAELDKLPGIGPAYAGKVVENRPYADFAEFKEKSGLSANLAESLKDLISF